MPLVRTGDLVEAAAKAGTAVIAFNVVTLEHAEAIVAAAAQADRAVTLQISENAVRFHGDHVRPLAAACVELARSSAQPVSLHLDHVTDSALLHESAGAGFSSAMFDAAALPYDRNVAATAAAARWAHASGLWLEAELGVVGGKAGQPSSAHAAGVRTDPGEAAAFVAATAVDALAVAVGNSHAMTSRTAALDVGLVARLAAAVPVPLVLHGSSGVPDDELAGAVRAGVAKVNVGTLLNQAYTSAVLDGADRGQADPRPYLSAARAAMTAAADRLLGLLPAF